MNAHRRLLALVFSAASLLTLGGLVAAQTPSPSPAPQGGHDMSSMPGMGGDSGPHAMAGSDGSGAADGAMSSEHMHMGPHMKMTAPRPRNAEDDRRAAALAQTAAAAIAKYRDFHVAVADGFQQFLPNVKLAMYHFTNYAYARQAQTSFDPTHPTSLLYKPLPGGGFELVGAMYTAPKSFSESQLNERVPLSVAPWHEHVNICLPAKAAYATSDWSKVGFWGSITTESECTAANGTFHPIIFNWMVHVYPFEQDPAKIWAH